MAVKIAIWGKIIGGGIGFMVGKWPGLVLGVILGSAFDRKARKGEKASYDAFQSSAIQTTFSRCTFLIMGKLAKADGTVKAQEIEAARQIMERLRLNEAHRLDAMKLFNEGKEEGFDIDSCLKELKDSIGRRVTLSQFFIELQLQIAYSDGNLTSGEKRVLQSICRVLGINRIQFEIINQRIAAQWKFSSYQRHNQRTNTLPLEQAYKILGVGSSVSDADLKKAYRRLMSQHHPDKLAAKGLPEEMMSIAKEKSQNIQLAYESVKKVRKSRGS